MDSGAGSLALSARRVGCALCAFVLAACQALLPESKVETPVEWNSFEQARDTVSAFKPFVTRRDEVASRGIDPYLNPAVSLLAYADIVQRFSAGNALRPEEYDPGIRRCLAAGERCSAYSIHARRIKRERIGNFWLDSLNFRREVETTGWSFSALVILVDDLVVYTTYSGQPSIRDYERTRNPLGPLQGWGDALPAVVR